MDKDPALRVVDLCFAAQGRAILRDVSFEVSRGSIVGIMGMSGSGKTTLLKCLAGLLRPTSGSVEMDGVDLAQLPEATLDRVRLHIGMVFQYAALFDSLSVFDNVSFGPLHHRKLPRRELESLVRARLLEVGMPGTEALYPGQLSGGMKKRVGLARALAMEPWLMLYDEPTSGLDPVIARSIDDLIVATRDRTRVTSVIVSHDVASVMRTADRVIFIEDGALLAQGTPDEIRSSELESVRRFLD